MHDATPNFGRSGCFRFRSEGKTALTSSQSFLFSSVLGATCLLIDGIATTISSARIAAQVEERRLGRTLCNQATPIPYPPTMVSGSCSVFAMPVVYPVRSRFCVSFSSLPSTLCLFANASTLHESALFASGQTPYHLSNTSPMPTNNFEEKLHFPRSRVKARGEPSLETSRSASPALDVDVLVQVI